MTRPTLILSLLLAALVARVPAHASSEAVEARLAGIERSLAELVELVRESLRRQESATIVQLLEVEQAAIGSLEARLEPLEAQRRELELKLRQLESQSDDPQLREFVNQSKRAVEDELRALESDAGPLRWELDDRRATAAALRERALETVDADPDRTESDR